MSEFMDSIYESLIEAFSDEGFYKEMLIDYQNDPAEIKARMTEYFRYSIAEAQQYGAAELAENGLGASVWLKPQPAAIAEKRWTDKLAFIASITGARGFENFQRMSAFMEEQAQSHIDENTWYLSILGISPRAQGQGIGRSLVEATLAEIDRRHEGSFLETYSQRAIPLYNRLGFIEVATHVEPTINHRYWVLVRAAR